MARVSSISLPATPLARGGAHCCPLCGGPNECRLCTSAAYKGSCWCVSVNIPEELLARVPDGFRNRVCICRDCVAVFQRERAGDNPPPLQPGDYYFDQGLMVFTAAYLRRRGYCCENNCRLCPYREPGA